MTEAETLQLSPRGRTWMWIGIVLALIGVALSVYSTLHHLELKAAGATDAVCNINATFNCDAVAKSQYSEIAGVPLGVFGLGYFASLLLLIGFAMGGGKAAREHFYAYSALVLVGVIVSAVLAVLSFTQVGAACLACIGVYIVCLLQGAALVIYRSEVQRATQSGAASQQSLLKEVSSGATTAAIAVAAVVAIFSFIPKPAPKIATSDSATTPADPNTPQLAATAEEIKITRSAYAGLGEDFRKGPDDAKVTIVEFADFQCPACSQVKTMLNQLEGEYKGKVQVVYRNFPLDSTCNSSVRQKMHEFSCNAAVMARCAGQYGKFWEMHGNLFDRQREMSNEKIKLWAKEIGLTDEQINSCWTNKDILAKIKDDVAEGLRLNIDSTPTLFFNGRKVIGGRGINDMRQNVEQLLQ